MAKVKYLGEERILLLGQYPAKKNDVIELPDELVNTDGDPDSPGFAFDPPMWKVLEAPAPRSSTAKKQDEGASSTTKPTAKKAAPGDDAKD